MPGLRWRVLLVGAVEPADEHVRVGRAHLQHYLATRLERLIERQWTDAVGVVAILSASPEGAADFPELAAGIAGLAETEVVSAGQIGRLVGSAIAGGVPVWVPSEILRPAIVLKIVEVNRCRASGLHHVHQ